jgi:uncharacterized ferritin-like protein (DUF455 family)
MELREFAERVLLATTLEEKLQWAAAITDEHPGPAFETPAAPGRPTELRFKPQSSGKAEFPGTHELENPRERGRLLHFFANHELLATELMALVLLRFPEAPAAFRRGVLQTLKDEQQHTWLYLQRMRECGVHFGELPVSGFFWRAVSRMETPMDYVAGLSLTFEQANLDFARHFANGFAAIGDDATARLLERIYRDEIGHVAHGLKWFRRWKAPDEADWEAFRRQLKFPLSPQRAKGLILNVEGRRAAGLAAEFIDELNVYSQSKGRTPTVFVFNPLAEGYVAKGASFTPIKHQAMLARDLATLPQFLCRQDDVVLVERRPSVQFLSGLKQAGFALPEFVELDSMRAKLSGRKLGGVRPWAWGPDGVELLAPLFPQVTGERLEPDDCFNERIAQLYSKAWSATFLRKVLAQVDSKPWLCTHDEVGTAVDSLEEAFEAIEAIRRRGDHKVVVKQALGLAGQNAIRLWEPALLENQRRWLTATLENGQEVVVEPWLERELDFSIQLEMSGGKLRLHGFTGLVNDRKGQFQANWAGPGFARHLPAIAALFRGTSGFSRDFHVFYASVFSLLERDLREAGFRGPLGIDAFIYRDVDGEARLKPIVEINPRYTMGRLTLELMRQTSPGSHGVFRLVSRKQARQEGFEDFAGYAEALRKRCPLRSEGEPVPRIHEWAVCLNDPCEAQACLAIFEVSRSQFAAAVTGIGADFGANAGG